MHTEYLIYTLISIEPLICFFFQGSTVLFVLLSELPQYNDKIIFGSALAPAAFMTTSPSMLIKWLANEDFYRFFTQTFGIKNELARDNFPFSLFATCTLNKYTLEFCLQTLISIVGGSREQINLVCTNNIHILFV